MEMWVPLLPQPNHNIQYKPSSYFFTSRIYSSGTVHSVVATAALLYILISLSSSTLSVLCYFNKHIHAKVVSDLAPIQHLCGFSVLFCGWFTQPLTGGSLWTSEHIRRQTQEPSALIMSDHSVHEHEIHHCPLSLSLSLAVSFSSSLTYSQSDGRNLVYTFT